MSIKKEQTVKKTTAFGTQAAELLERNTEKSLEKGILIRLKGTVQFCGVDFRYSLSRQVNGAPFPYRGTMSVRDPETGGVMEAKGADKRNLEKKAVKRQAEGEDTHVIVKRRLLNKQLNFKPKRDPWTAAFEEIKQEIFEYLLKEVNWMSYKYRESILRSKRESVEPKSITAVDAVMLYFRDFLRKTRSALSEKTIVSHEETMLDVFRDLSVKPMCKFIQQDFRHNKKYEILSKERKKMLHEFWAYCLDKKYCIRMDNPIPLPEKRAESIEVLKKKASIPKTLSDNQIQAVYNYCVEHTTGLACALCLMLNGYPSDFVIQLKWKDIVFSDQMVIVKRRVDHNKATKDYTRPCNDLLAQTLRNRYEILIKDFSKSELINMPVTGSSKNPRACITNKSLTKRIMDVLQSVGVANEVFQNMKNETSTAAAKRLLRNTFRHIVYAHMGIQNDIGTMEFLLGQPLSSVTNDYYTSFTSPEAMDRLLAIQNRSLPGRELPGKIKRIELNDEYEIVEIQPNRTDRILEIRFEGETADKERIEISAAHGVSVQYRVRELNEDGTPKRATKKKKTNVN